VPAKLRALHAEGKKLVIFTNQGGINGTKGYDKSKERMICGKIEDIIADLGVPVQALVATTDDVYRKPATDMWDYMVSHLNNGVKPALDQCVFVGDAAGRPAGASRKKKDFSCTDRKFAHNVGIAFRTPEEFFLNKEAEAFDWECADLSKVPQAGEVCEGGLEALLGSSVKRPELVIFVGFPASGKSTFCKTYLVPRGYVHINRDTLKTQERCQRAAQDALAQGKSVAVDNTNPSVDIRSQYIAIAKRAGVPVRCFRFNVDEMLAQHLNYFRERITAGASAHVPRIGYATFKKQFVEPELSEGFTEIKRINFVANIFASEEDKRSFFQLH
jgi:bifunctional polynucleotide phosphatase/kinase